MRASDSDPALAAPAASRPSQAPSTASPCACSQCGAAFHCAADQADAPCWCASLPALPRVAYLPAAGCLCPACLRAALGASALSSSDHA